MRSPASVPWHAVAGMLALFLAAGAIFSGESLASAAEACCDDPKPAEASAQFEPREGPDGIQGEGNWRSIRLFVRTLVATLLLMVFTMMVIAEIRRPGILSSFYWKLVRREQRGGWKGKYSRKGYSGINLHAPADSHKRKELRPKSESAWRRNPP
eukprot:evm.model.scf_348EXC.2 EVM.evm.TU.scf_348EXC.2   scf_348EXC:36607-39482(+)